MWCRRGVARCRAPEAKSAWAVGCGQTDLTLTRGEERVGGGVRADGLDAAAVAAELPQAARGRGVPQVHALVARPRQHARVVLRCKRAHVSLGDRGSTGVAEAASQRLGIPWSYHVAPASTLGWVESAGSDGSVRDGRVC